MNNFYSLDQQFVKVAVFEIILKFLKHYHIIQSFGQYDHNLKLEMLMRFLYTSQLVEMELIAFQPLTVQKYMQIVGNFYLYIRDQLV